VLKHQLRKLQQNYEAQRNETKKWKLLANESREGNNNLLKEIRRLEKELRREKDFIQCMF
jgi:hypothetical protein